MTPQTRRFVLAFGLVAFVGCEKLPTDDPDLAANYRHNKYNADIVTGTYSDQHADQGTGIDPETLHRIDDTVTTVYGADLRRCLEDEMDAQDSRFLRAGFEVEFTIEPTGLTHDAHLLSIDLKQQDAKGHDVGALPPAHLGKCIVAAVDAWEFDPAPQVTFVDTYRGNLAEAY